MCFDLCVSIKDRSFYCEITMFNDFNDPPHHLPAAMSKIYTSGNVNVFEGCFPSSAGKPREVAIESSHEKSPCIALKTISNPSQ